MGKLKSLEYLASLIDHQNWLLYLYFKELDMAKYCKQIGGFVANDYDCEKCNQCAGKDR